MIGGVRVTRTSSGVGSTSVLYLSSRESKNVMKFEIDFSETDMDSLNFIANELNAQMFFATTFGDDDFIKDIEKARKTIDHIKTSIHNKLFK